MPEPLSDEQAHDRLLEARQRLGEEPARTTRATTALDAARRVLSGLAMALLIASETGADDVDGVKPPDD